MLLSSGKQNSTQLCNSMAHAVVKYADMMGETGMGIDNVEEIDMSLDNKLVHAWSEYSCL